MSGMYMGEVARRLLLRLAVRGPARTLPLSLRRGSARAPLAGRLRRCASQAACLCARAGAPGGGRRARGRVPARACLGPYGAPRGAREEAGLSSSRANEGTRVLVQGLQHAPARAGSGRHGARRAGGGRPVWRRGAGPAARALGARHAGARAHRRRRQLGPGRGGRAAGRGAGRAAGQHPLGRALPGARAPAARWRGACLCRPPAGARRGWRRTSPRALGMSLASLPGAMRCRS